MQWQSVTNCSVTDRGDNKKSMTITSIEVNSEKLSLCLINDCGDMDVPLIELQLTG